ncbi:MAG: histidinol-phosphate transaminase [Methanobrevibacter sp.]|jgi:histidinol-phosphate aminotransferase|nr:histidinol-phosphate transaminase [Candidatus Methanoflexus mossambicus]
MKVRQIVKELDSYVPGRSQDEIANQFNLNKEDIIKLGSNENPWGSSKRAIEAVKKNLDLSFRYPETDLKELKLLIADYCNLNLENIIIGGDGADEIIDILAKTFMDVGDEFITPLPTYTYYEFTFKPYGAIPVYAKWDLKTNSLDVNSVLNNITDKTKMIFLCTPNNPTGGVISKEDIEKIINSTDALIVIDEAYIEYTGNTLSNIDLIEKYSNVFIMRTMSKVLGLAGMRVGYGMSNPQLIEYMHRIKPVFSLTRASQVAAVETFKDKLFIKESTVKGIESRDFLYNQLSRFKNLNVFNSSSNYIFVGIKDTGFTAKEFTYKLMEKGVIIRDCTSFKGLDEYWIRISIGTMKDDEKFIEILHEIIE